MNKPHGWGRPLGITFAGSLLVLLTYFGLPFAKDWEETRRYPTEAAARTALQTNPGDIRALRTLAMAAQTTGHRDEALSCWNQAAMLEPDNIHTQFWRGLSFHLTGRNKTAYPILQRVSQSGHRYLAPEATRILQNIPAGQRPARTAQTNAGQTP